MNSPCKRKTAARAAAFLLALILALSCACAGAESVVSVRRARIYASPSAGARSASIPAGTVMELTAQRDGWIQVRRKGVTGYMAASDAVEIVNCNSAAGYLKSAAPMYKAYGKSAKYGTLPAGTAVTVYACAGDWALVGCLGKRGFIAKAALTSDKPAPSAPEAPEITVTKGLYAYVAADGAKVYQSWSTSSKVLGRLSANTKLAVGAIRGDWALVGAKGRYGYMLLSDLSRDKTAAPEPPASKPSAPVIQAMDWWKSDIQTIFARGVTATITDVETGISWREIRKGGTNHADCQPLTAQDTANMKKACGGKWSWNRRAVIVTIDGAHYAASMNCMPHGGGSVTGNNFNGHHCYHFINSRTSTGTKPDADHQAAIQRALALNAKLS